MKTISSNFLSSNSANKTGAVHVQSISGLILPLLIALGSLVATVESQAEPDNFLKVTTRQVGGRTHFIVENSAAGNVTATFDVKLKNMVGSASFPYTVTLPGKQTTDIFTLVPQSPESAWKFDYTFACNLGSTKAVPNEGQIYELPYAPGSSYRVIQGHHGSFSHTGEADEYAIDWKMPEGTPVYAAREGIVVKAKDDSNEGGPDRKFQQVANCVLIQHDDGTVGIYGHLKKASNQVKAGDHVKAGEPIGLSGNTGFSSGPHLHFAVFVTRSGSERVSLPVKFRAVEGDALIPASGHAYMTPLNPVTRMATASR